MYFQSKYNKKVIILVIVCAVILLALVVGFQMILSKRTQQAIDLSGQESESESETEVYLHMTIYENPDGEVTYDMASLVSSGAETSVYSVLAREEISLAILPKEGKEFASVSVLTAEGEEIQAEIQETEEGVNITFPMPESSVFVKLTYQEDPEWLAKQTEPETEFPTEAATERQTEAKTELETTKQTEPETKAPAYDTYNLALYGATPENTKDFGDPFQADYFLNCVGQTFEMRNPASYYFGVGKLTFSEEIPEQEEGTVKKYLYFGDDPTWLLLAVYYPLSDSYVISDTTGRANAPAETQAPEITAQNTEAAVPPVSQGSAGETVQGGSIQTGGEGTVATPPVTTTDTFSLENVSTVFLSFVGDEQGFSDQISAYVFDHGLTGNITGTFGEYVIDPEAQTATFSIALSSGGTIAGQYDKNRNSYSLNGL